jgi:hypothetical protein
MALPRVESAFPEVSAVSYAWKRNKKSITKQRTRTHEEMNTHMLKAHHRVLISARYDDKGFDVNGVFHEGSVICLSSLLLNWSPMNFKEITPDRYSGNSITCFSP